LSYYQKDEIGFKPPRKAIGGIKARSETGEFARNWWAKKWLIAMEHLMMAARLQRGRRYARQGQVLTLEENREGITAKVQGTRPAPYHVSIKVSHLSDSQWNKVLDAMSGRAVFAAQLLAGEMPQTIEEAFSAAGVSLFPAHAGDLKTSCSCPDWANPCKHVAAVFYILGDRFDEDPFLLFRMRGKTQDQVLEGLRKRRGGEAPQEEVQEETEETAAAVQESGPTLKDELENFWQIPEEALQDFTISVKAPNVRLPILQRLGDPDLPGVSLQEQLKNAYEMASQTILLLAFQGNDLDTPSNSEE
jgi:uncharacterized Zn finger protein